MLSIRGLQYHLFAATVVEKTFLQIDQLRRLLLGASPRWPRAHDATLAESQPPIHLEAAQARAELPDPRHKYRF
jgi:hypothetical protein